MNVHQFAALVRELRRVQKAGGKGYKSKVDHDKAAPLEKQVDDAIEHILNGAPWPWPNVWPFNQ